MKTTAAILVETGKPLVLGELEIPTLKPGQVLVEIAVSGVCHTQVLECRGYRGEDKFLPHCLGHEGSGVVLRPWLQAAVERNALTWTVTSQGNWFTVTPGSGATPDSLTITPTQLDTLQPGTYLGSVTVTVTSPAGTLNSPHVIQLTLVVVPGPLKNFYLPLVGG